MTLLVFILLYFLPSIIGHNKRDSGGIFLLNLFLGWTVVAWIIALVWACTSEPRFPIYMIGAHGGFCCQCGSMKPAGARFCPACGRPV